MSLFALGRFTLHSGEESSFKIDCSSLGGEDWKCLALMVSRLAGPFSSVGGIPRGGLALAEALKAYAMPGVGPHLLVDDVLTTGRSMKEARDRLVEEDPKKAVKGAVVFARRWPPPWVRALFLIAGGVE